METRERGSCSELHAYLELAGTAWALSAALAIYRQHHSKNAYMRGLRNRSDCGFMLPPLMVGAPQRLLTLVAS